MTNEELKNKRLGAILGGAIGDAMGNPTEFQSLEMIKRTYGPQGVERFEKWWQDGDGKSFAPYTDDTQMAEQVLRAILDHRRKTSTVRTVDDLMEAMAQRFVEWSRNPQGGHRAPGGACMAGCRALSENVPWHEAGGATAGGCGSVMRAYPFGLFDEPEEAAFLAVEHSLLTHGDPIALAACAAMATGVALLLNDEPVDTTLIEMIDAAKQEDGRTAGMMQDAVERAHTGESADSGLSQYLGWAAHDAIAATCFLLARFPEDPRGAILQGANSDGDSDSLATLAGALLGARHGLSALPPEWVRDVERSNVFLTILDDPPAQVPEEVPRT